MSSPSSPTDRTELTREVQEAVAEAFKVAPIATLCGPTRLWLKQLKVDRLNAYLKSRLNACFPQFMSLQSLSDKLAAAGMKIEVSQYCSYVTSTGRLRRYAGDSSLSGGRYYSLCR